MTDTGCCGPQHPESRASVGVDRDADVVELAPGEDHEGLGVLVSGCRPRRLTGRVARGSVVAAQDPQQRRLEVGEGEGLEAQHDDVMPLGDLDAAEQHVGAEDRGRLAVDLGHPARVVDLVGDDDARLVALHLDFEAIRAVIGTVVVKGAKASATVSFTNFGEKVTVRYKLVWTPKGWRIFDLTSADGTGSLRAVYFPPA